VATERDLHCASSCFLPCLLLLPSLSNEEYNCSVNLRGNFYCVHHEVIGPKLHLLKESNGQDYRGGKYGFFSSHAANTMGVTTILFLACSWINRKWRYLFYLIPLAIIYSRMYCGAHYPLDVLFGTIDGLFFGYVTFIIFRRYFFKSPLADV
jgi:membrane-associated phospholipid phosphatase